ncbi:hypothetical protein CR513_27393, partial [Mucuna pruriens]
MSFDLTPCGIGVKESNLRANYLQKREDDAYRKRKNPTLHGPLIRGRLRKIQEEVQHQLTTLKDPREGHEGTLSEKRHLLNNLAFLGSYWKTRIHWARASLTKRTLKNTVPSRSRQRLVRYGLGRDLSDSVSAKRKQTQQSWTDSVLDEKVGNKGNEIQTQDLNSVTSPSIAIAMEEQ